LFGVSAEAAVFVAAFMPHSKLPSLNHCWASIYNLTEVARLQGDSSTSAEVQVQLAAVAGAQQPQPQPWLDTLLPNLLQPVLLYGAAYIGADSQSNTHLWAVGSQNAATVICRLHTAVLKCKHEPGKTTAAVNTGSGRGSSNTSAEQPAAGAAGMGRPCAPFTLQLAVNSEMLLLTLNLLQQLQRLRKAAAGTNSSSSSSSQGVVSAAAQASDAAAAADGAQEALTCWLLVVARDVQAALLQADTAAQQGVLSSAESAAAGELRVVWQQQAGAVCTALEPYVRSGSSTWPNAMQEKFRRSGVIAGVCADERYGLARGGSSEQHLALFRLLVSLLKRSAGGGVNASDSVPTAVGQAACSMLKDASAACAAGVDGKSDASQIVLWLLVLGRCCLQWAAALHRVERQGVSYMQLLQQTQLGPILCRQLELVDDLAGSLAAGNGRGSSLLERLLSAGYDLKPIVQGIETLLASYREVALMHCEPDAVVVDRVSSLIGALVSLGDALSVFAVCHCCNNPRCGNTRGLSEKAIVCGSGCLCAGCKVARYCGKACQQACWTPGAHKPACKMLRKRSAVAKA
jgi:hypothetical protein